MRMIVLLAAAAAIAACGKKEAADAAAPREAAVISQPTFSGPPSEEAEASADTAWIELMGEWAPKGACADDTQKWIVEARAFHHYEMHCAVASIELLENGVKASADCSVEGDNDGVPDVFDFIRRPDATLTVVQTANGAKTEGLVPCSEDMIP